MYIYIYVYVCICICIHIDMNIHAYVYVYLCVCVCVCVCVFVCVCVCVCACMCIGPHARTPYGDGDAKFSTKISAPLYLPCEMSGELTPEKFYLRQSSWAVCKG